ncbi:MAG TPA: hypothetical protein VMD08_03865 [Candidatus Baltobacteraceae bacterium]|nr:hypothetical protein [Candidatus Baltobacteraceae bacterium]
MIAAALVKLGIPEAGARAGIVAVLALVGGLLTAYFPAAPFLPPVAAFLVAVATIIDPNASHADSGGQAVG